MPRHVNLGALLVLVHLGNVLESCDFVATMGCSTIKLDAEDSEIRDWALDDPHGQDPDTVREIRDDIERRFKTLFDELYLGEP